MALFVTLAMGKKPQQNKPQQNPAEKDGSRKDGTHQKRCRVESFDVDPHQIVETLTDSDHTYRLRTVVLYPGSTWFPRVSFQYVVHSDQWARNTYDIRRYTNFRAQFASDDDSDPSCCEFRQFVRGGFYLWGIRIPQPMPNGTTLHPTHWQEDGTADGKRYGHRSDPDRSNDYYAPVRATGRVYVGSDNPGMSCIALGTPYKIELHFIDVIIDTCPGVPFWDLIKAYRTWDMVREGH